MKILIASDSFKDALDSLRLCEAIERGLKLANPGFHTSIFPLADGGEGTSDIVSYHLGGRHHKLIVNDALFRPVEADYLITDNGKTAFIEMAKAAGLQLLSKKERNPMLTSTYGVGQMINHAIDNGVENVILTIGGSATNDAGMGMAIAVGFSFTDKNNNNLTGIGSDLIKIEKIIVQKDTQKKLTNIRFSVVCDVTNPLYGPLGAVCVFGRQKGADDASIKILDDGLLNIATKSNLLSLANREGAGAAGGLGFGAMAFLGAELYRGIDLIMQITDFENHLKDADIVITGEGKLDSQTVHGKLIHGVASLASKYKIPVVAICGALETTPADIHNLGLKAAFSITPHPIALNQAISNTAQNVESLAFNIGMILNLNGLS